MVKVYNSIIPFKGYLAINLFGVLFVRKEFKGLIERDPTIENHEAIHTAQMRELLYVFFYIIYFFEWVYRLIFYTKTAYKGISFEKEAYTNQNNLYYLKTRKHYAMWRR